ncbi:DTW domain-containing protein [Comamonas faecalis]|uniref:DTW domain-containing protein n=1 Tax=Comamonas faecalis TaxID=1387849 RepID=UPI000C9FD45F
MQDPAPTNARRAQCPRCLRAASACICSAVQPVAHSVQVLILLHPQELHQAKGTGWLAHLCLARSRVLVGEAFDPPLLADALTGAWDAADATTARRTALLYPEDAQGAAPTLLATPTIAPHWLATPGRLRLVVLDATWRKSRKMLHANPALQRLPRLALSAPHASRYAIRKAHAPHQRSTLEALHQALALLEPANLQLAGLGRAMDAFIARQHQLREAHCALQHPPDTDKETT